MILGPLALLGSLALQSSAALPLELRRGERIALIGNALAERIQHHGFLESELHARFPALGLSLRNLGFAADELALHTRSMNFGKFSADGMESDLEQRRFLVWDRYLDHCDASLVLAFFGTNESFAGEEGLAAFRQDLERFVEHVRAQRYDGAAPPRLVLCSPIPFEDLGDPSLPDGREHDARLAAYAAVMRGVAEERAVPFVDLYGAMRAAYARCAEPLTINGIHLNEAGNRELGRLLCAALFGGEAPPVSAELRAAVVAKDELWFQRYRAPDGFNIWGGRSRQVYEDAEDRTRRFSNFEVMQREMDRLDALVAEHDRRIQAFARGERHEIDPARLPPLLEVRTNKPGEGPRGEHLFLGGEEAIRRMSPGAGLAVELFADETLFPELVNPVQMAFDPQGRLWVAVWPTYPRWRPDEEPADKLLVLEDTDGDGRADRCTVFAEGLHNPTGFEHWNGGVLLAEVPDLLFLADTDGDGRADRRERILHGIDSADTHHSANSFVLGPDGALYFQEGTFHRSQIESPYGPVRNRDGCVWRFEPRTFRVERHVAYDFANPHGHVFDRWGQDFVTDGTGNDNYFALPFSGHLRAGDKHRSYFPFFRQRSRPAAATEILASAHFPPEFQGNYLIANVIGFQGVFRYRIEEEGSGFGAVEEEPILTSSDPSFRPVDLEVGPDGALYLLDWHNPIIGHLQHHIRDPSRDRAHGRVYRVRAAGRALLQPPRVAGESTAELLELLRSGDDRLRYRVRIELSARDSDEVARAAAAFARALDPAEPEHEHHLLEALWLSQQHDRLDRELLLALLEARDPRARAAATRVLRQMRERVPDALALLAERAADEHPRVRLEALVGASFFDSAEAARVALRAGREPSDRFLEYALRESLRTLEPFWRAALRSDARFCEDDPAGLALLLERVDAAELEELPPRAAVHAALATRPGVAREKRLAAVAAFARAQGLEPAEALLLSLSTADRRGGAQDAQVVQELMDALGDRAALEHLAMHAQQRATRARAFLRIVRIDGSTEPAYALASGSAEGLLAFLEAAPAFDAELLDAELALRIRPLQFTAAAPELRSAAIRAMAHAPAPSATKLADATLLVADERFLAPATELLRSLPRAALDPAAVQSLVHTLAASLAGLEPARRTSDEANAAVELARELADLLPAEAAAAARAGLADLGGAQVLLRTVPHQMLYDLVEIEVQAGRALSILFQNNDLMPHNLVIGAPGALVAIGERAEREALLPAAQARHYVPEDPAVLWATRLLLPGESQRLDLVAPPEACELPFLCTYPGHWRVMNGVLRVVPQLPQGARVVRRAGVASSSAPRAFVRDWKLEDLEGSFAPGWRAGRSLERGAALFAEAGCASCHAACDEEQGVAPRLSLLARELRGSELLRHVLAPSERVLAGFEVHGVELDDGTRASGLLLSESAEELVLLPALLDPGRTERLRKEWVESRWVSPLSPMPSGLLVTFEPAEILDLFAYVEEAGEREAARRADPRWLSLEPAPGPGAGRHVVLLAGDDEYRSEEALPMLARILAEQHGFRCTVLFSQDPATGEIRPDERRHMPGLEVLGEAQLVIAFLRFREWADQDMAHFARYVESGRPLIGIRTTTHAFHYEDPSSPYAARYDWRGPEWEGGFGRQILGETWVAHHGKHGVEGTRGVLAPGARAHPILRGVQDVFGPTDVYAIRALPSDARVLLEGEVLASLAPDAPAVGDGRNEPRMPLVWTRESELADGKLRRVLCSTIGASQDLLSEDLRRLLVNAVYWGLCLEERIPERSAAELPAGYEPTPYGFGTFVRGRRPADRAPR